MGMLASVQIDNIISEKREDEGCSVKFTSALKCHQQKLGHHPMRTKKTTRLELTKNGDMHVPTDNKPTLLLTDISTSADPALPQLYLRIPLNMITLKKGLLIYILRQIGSCGRPKANTLHCRWTGGVVCTCPYKPIPADW